jgi:hypothetical protein
MSLDSRNIAFLVTGLIIAVVFLAHAADFATQLSQAIAEEGKLNQIKSKTKEGTVRNIDFVSYGLVNFNELTRFLAMASHPPNSVNWYHGIFSTFAEQNKVLGKYGRRTKDSPALLSQKQVLALSSKPKWQAYATPTSFTSGYRWQLEVASLYKIPEPVAMLVQDGILVAFLAKNSGVIIGGCDAFQPWSSGVPACTILKNCKAVIEKHTQRLHSFVQHNSDVAPDILPFPRNLIVQPEKEFVTFMSRGGKLNFGHAVNDFFVLCSNYLGYQKRNSSLPVVILPKRTMLIEWYRCALPHTEFILLPQDKSEKWFSFPNGLLVNNMMIEIDYGLQDAADNVVPHLQQGAAQSIQSMLNLSSNMTQILQVKTDKLHWLRRLLQNPPRLILQVKDPGVSARVDFGNPAAANIKDAFTKAGYFNFQPKKHSWTEKVLLFSRCDIYVTEYGSPLSYILLSRTPALVFVYAPPSMRRQFANPDYQYNHLHHGVYVLGGEGQRVTSKLSRSTARMWVEEISQIVSALPRDFLEREWPLLRQRFRANDLKCPSKLYFNCAVKYRTWDRVLTELLPKHNLTTTSNVSSLLVLLKTLQHNTF